MGKVDRYINSIYKNINGNKEEINVLKQESKDHLLQSIHDLEKEGKTEEESIDIAINRFGEVKQLKKELANIYKVQKKFSKSILIIALIVLFIGISSLMYKIFIYNRPSIIADNIINNIENSIKQNNQISNETLNKLFEDNKKPLKYTGKTLKYIAIFQYNNSNKNKEELLYTYPKLKNAKNIYPDIKKLNGDLERIGYIANASSSKVLVNKNSTWLIRIAYISGEYKYIINYFIITCFVIYWLLFGIWATINAYHKVGYKFGWTVSFFIFNIFAYMLFMFKNKTKI